MSRQLTRTTMRSFWLTVTGTLAISNTYGDVYKQYWGCDGIVARYNTDADVGVSKVYADGDIFVFGTDQKSDAYKATADDDQWDQWIAANDVQSRPDEPTSLRFDKRGGTGGGHVHSVLSYQWWLSGGQSETMTTCLTRGVTETDAIERFDEALTRSADELQDKLRSDRKFYAGVPVLTGDWPRAWKNGLFYHFETIRMNIHPPMGIYKHHWDGMQIATPRTVLGEAAIDSMCLSYADSNYFQRANSPPRVSR